MEGWTDNLLEVAIDTEEDVMGVLPGHARKYVTELFAAIEASLA